MSRFRFKTFEVEHLQSTMKVGTDAVMLAAWINPELATSGLDIGTGCGVMALILASRSPKLFMTAIDIDQPSIKEAALNFTTSPWSSKLLALNTTLQEFASMRSSPFDLIISNPPWFINSLKVPANQRRNNARHDDTLNADQLLDGIIKLLNPNGKAGLILPTEEAKIFQQKALAAGLYLHRRCTVTPREGKQPHRMMLEFTTKQSPDQTTSGLTIYNCDGRYTKEYKDLTRPFYLNF